MLTPRLICNSSQGLPNLRRCVWCDHPHSPIDIRLGDPKPHEIETRVMRAIQMLLRHDSFLLDKNVNERSITHKLAECLQREFCEWHVDCEYNRIGKTRIRKALPGLRKELLETGNRKALPGSRKELRELRLLKTVETDNATGDTVFPDIIVHHRGDETDNLLVVEVKKSTSTRNAQRIDKVKLELYKERLQYRFAAFLLLQAGVKVPNDRRWCLKWLSGC